MKSIDLKKYYPHPLHEGENTVILVTDEVANALERFIREENNDTLRRYRAKAYYSLDCENGIEHHILFRKKLPKNSTKRNSRCNNLTGLSQNSL